MATQTSNPTIWTPKNGYGVTEYKKAELDALTLQVTNAQYAVNNFQSIVNSLTDKVNNFQGFLNTAEATRTAAYNNKILLNQLVKSAAGLKDNSATAKKKMSVADSDTQNLSSNIRQVITKLIYTAEVLNKLSNMVVKKKAVNPLISDELISMIAASGSDANNAVALTLVALQSTFAAEASNMESAAAIKLASDQSLALYNTLTGTVEPLGKGAAASSNTGSLKSLLYTAYDNAVTNYKRLQKALGVVTDQLNDATADLARAQVKLQSLQLGLAAANAAALA
jgi:hypothetical protein